MMTLSACTPALDWRSVGVPDAKFVTQLPCRPGRFQRVVGVAGLTLTLDMLSCEAVGVTYGVASAEVGDPTRVEPVLEALSARFAAGIRAHDVNTSALTLDGSTPFKGNVSARLHGYRPDGSPVQASMSTFARGTRVFQMSAIGTQIPENAVRPFEEGGHFDLADASADPR